MLERKQIKAGINSCAMMYQTVFLITVARTKSPKIS